MSLKWPISRFLREDLNEKLSIRLTTPAHKGYDNRQQWMNTDLSIFGQMDLPYIPKHVWNESEELASRYYDTQATYYFPSGTSYAIIAGLHAAFKKNDTILIGRNVHVSVVSGLMLLGAKIHWLCPDGPWFIFKSEQVNQKVEQHPEITGIVLSNPSYEGHISDISAVAELCKSKGIKLVIDESLGSHWVGNNLFPQTSIHHADMVFHSLHKRVGALVP